MNVMAFDAICYAFSLKGLKPNLTSLASLDLKNVTIFNRSGTWTLFYLLVHVIWKRSKELRGDVTSVTFSFILQPTASTLNFMQKRPLELSLITTGGQFTFSTFTSTSQKLGFEDMHIRNVYLKMILTNCQCNGHQSLQIRLVWIESVSVF